MKQVLQRAIGAQGNIISYKLTVNHRNLWGVASVENSSIKSKSSLSRKVFKKDGKRRKKKRERGRRERKKTEEQGRRRKKKREGR